MTTNESSITTEVGEQAPNQSIQSRIFVDESNQPIYLRLEVDDILKIKGTDVYVNGIRKCSLSSQKHHRSKQPTST